MVWCHRHISFANEREFFSDHVLEYPRLVDLVFFESWNLAWNTCRKVKTLCCAYQCYGTPGFGEWGGERWKFVILSALSFCCEGPIPYPGRGSERKCFNFHYRNLTTKHNSMKWKLQLWLHTHRCGDRDYMCMCQFYKVMSEWHNLIHRLNLQLPHSRSKTLPTPSHQLASELGGARHTIDRCLPFRCISR